MSQTVKEGKKEELVRKLFEMGAHFGFSRKRRHPSVDPFIYGYKNNTAVIDLEKSLGSLEKAEAFFEQLGMNKSVIVFVGNKPEAQSSVQKGAMSIMMPYVTERWLGGTLTNFKQMTKRINHLKWLREAEASGELAKYTKKERLLLAKERKDLERYFEGISDLARIPQAMFVVDAKAEAIAVAEAKQMKVKIVALAGSDCDIRGIDYPIVANDNSRLTIAYVTERLVQAYKDGLAKAPAPVEKTDTTNTAGVEVVASATLETK